MLSLVDTHCHLDFYNFDTDRPDVILRAKQAGVQRIVVPAVDLVSSQRALGLAEQYPGVYAAVGIHPNDLQTWDAADLVTLENLAKNLSVVAIGEIGLDYYRNKAPKPLQREAFRLQLELAGKLCLPVIVHIRNASPDDRSAIDDALEILGNWYSALASCQHALTRRPGVLHSFSDRLDAAQVAANMHFYIGISGPITFRNANELQKVVAGVKLENLLVETDAPFLTPHPHRGERNEPAYVYFVAEKIAEIRNQDLVNVAQHTTENAENLFSWRVKD